MPSSYPGSLDNFATNRTDYTPLPVTHAADHNNLNDALNKIEAELGVSPSGSYASVVDRVAAMELDVGGGGPPSYQASFYTGPLGVNNILPTTGKVLANLWPGRSISATDSRAQVSSRMSDTGRTFDCIATKLGANLSLDDGLSTGGTSGRGETWIHSLGSVPIVSWDWNVTPASVAAGTQDATMDTVIARFAGAGFRIMLRPWREMNIQSSTSYFTGGTGSTAPQLATIAANWKAGWQYMVNYFHNHGATNVGFCWCPSEKAGPTGDATTSSRAQILACYPGATYVDWVAVDAYNHDGGSGGGAWSTPLHGNWASFDEVFNYHVLGWNGYAPGAYVDEYGVNKPFFIWETGSKYDTLNVPNPHTVDPNRKANWFRDISTTCLPHMSGLRGIQFFDQWVVGEHNDWMVDSNQPAQTTTQGSTDATTYNGWKDLMAILMAPSGINVIGGAT